ncbi:NAD(P)/FAD-dependent oxidoreductase [Streptomyces sp. BH106]|uniref:NAD(P)/FAD-dependent oxidoreductase n=1 Tax=Streptomyces sp. BH106 TaxID=3410409 RepID=UPI003CF9F3BC
MQTRVHDERVPDHPQQRTAHRVVVAGAGLAAMRVAEELRLAGYDGRLLLVGDEKRLPYDRPPLSKDVLRGDLDDTTFHSREHFAEQGIELRLGVAADRVDTDDRSLRLADGTALAYDDLVIATGLRPRRLSGLRDVHGLHALRSLDDALALRTDLIRSRRALVVGAGFIGCEAAAAIRTLGIETVLVDVEPAPLARVLGERVGGLLQRLHVAEDVDVRCGLGLHALKGEDRVTGAILSDGTSLDVDVVVTGVGSVPATGWLADSGIQLAAPSAGGGVVADAVGRTNVPHVWAVGDAAAWPDGTGSHRRVEHWSSAIDQACVLAQALTGTQAPAPLPVPTFWSDQYGLKIQAVGHPSGKDTVHIVEDDGRKFLAYYEAEGALTAVVGAGMPRDVRKMHSKVAAAAPIDSVLPKN